MRRPCLLGTALAALGAFGCSGSSSGGTSSAGDAGTGADAASHAEGGHDASGSDGSAATDAPGDGDDGGDASSGVHNGTCCARNASYDATCTAMGEPSVAYVCFCPVGGSGGSIDPSCTINMGSELVCCP